MLFEEGENLDWTSPCRNISRNSKIQRCWYDWTGRDTTYTTTPAKKRDHDPAIAHAHFRIDYAGIGSQEFKAIYAKAGVPSGIGNDNMVLADKMKILGSLPLKTTSWRSLHLQP